MPQSKWTNRLPLIMVALLLMGAWPHDPWPGRPGENVVWSHVPADECAKVPGDFTAAELATTLTEAIAANCRLQLEAGTYVDADITVSSGNPDQVEIRGRGVDSTGADLSTLQMQVHPGATNDPVIEIIGGAPNEVTVSHLAIDGNKGNQLVNNGAKLSVQLAVFTGGGDQHHFHDLHIHDGVTQGIQAAGSDNGTIQRVTVEDMGCHTAFPENTPCPNYVGEPDLGVATGRKTDAIAIQVTNATRGWTVEHSHAEDATKQGMEMFATAPICSGGTEVSGHLFRNNSCLRASSCFVANGACRSTFLLNVATDSGMGAPNECLSCNLGAGFRVSDGGEDVAFNSNLSVGSQRMGYDLSGNKGGLTATGNTSRDACAQPNTWIGPDFIFSTGGSGVFEFFNAFFNISENTGGVNACPSGSYDVKDRNSVAMANNVGDGDVAFRTPVTGLCRDHTFNEGAVATNNTQLVQVNCGEGTTTTTSTSSTSTTTASTTSTSSTSTSSTSSTTTTTASTTTTTLPPGTFTEPGPAEAVVAMLEALPKVKAICSEPLNWDGGTGLAGGVDPTDSEGVDARECGTGGVPLNLDGSATSSTVDIDTILRRPGMHPMFNWIFKKDVSDLSGDNIDTLWGLSSTTTNGTVCQRNYQLFSTDFLPDDPDQRVKTGQVNFDACTGTNCLFQCQFEHISGPWDFVNCVQSEGADNGTVVALDDCRTDEDYCMFEMCADYVDGVGRTWRHRVTRLNDGASEIITPGDPDGATGSGTWTIDHGDNIVNLFVQNQPDSPNASGGDRHLTHTLFVLIEPSDPTFWIDSACEVEGTSIHGPCPE